METETIPGGATLWARQTIESEIFYSKPAMWFKIWFYLVNRASHKETKKYERGESFLQYDWISEKTGATLDQIKKCVGWLREKEMVSTRRSTRGVWLKITNYSQYQDINTYSYKIKAPDEAPEKHQRSTREALRYNKNDKNDKNDNILQSSDCGEELVYEEENLPDKILNKQIVSLMAKFREYNPAINFGHKTHRTACKNLIDKFTYEKAVRTVDYAISVQGKPYTPTITTPTQLINKLGDLKAYAQRQQAQAPLIVKI